MAWGIIGVVVTIIIGLLPYMIKKKRRPCRIVYIPTESFNLYNNLVGYFDSLEILKSKQPIKNNLIFISGTFVCSGNSDIIGVDHVIKIDLPEKCKWVDAKLCRCSRDFNPSIIKNDENKREICVAFDLFKRDEYISLQALVECEDYSYIDDAIGLHNNLRFFHRIQNTEDIEVGEAIIKKKSWKRFIFSLFVFTLLLLSLFLVTGNSYKMESIVYREVSSNREYYAYLINDSTVVLQKRNTIAVLFGGSTVEMPINEFLSRYRPLYVYDNWNPNVIANVTMVCIILLFVISILIPDFLAIRRNNKLYSLYHTLEFKK